MDRQSMTSFRTSTISTTSSDTSCRSLGSPISQSTWNAQRSSTQSTLSAWSVQTPRGGVLGLPFVEVEYVRDVEDLDEAAVSEAGSGMLDTGETTCWWAGMTPKASVRRESQVEVKVHIDSPDTTEHARLDDSPTLPMYDLPIIDVPIAYRPRMPSPYSPKEMEDYFSLSEFYVDQPIAGPSRSVKMQSGGDNLIHATSGEREGSIKSSSSCSSRGTKTSKRTRTAGIESGHSLPPIPTRTSSRKRPVVTSRASSLRLSSFGTDISPNIPPVPLIPTHLRPSIQPKPSLSHPPPVALTRASSYNRTILPTPLSSIRETSPPRPITDLDRTLSGDWALRKRPNPHTLHRSTSQPALSTSTMPRKFALRRSTSSQFGTSTISSFGTGSISSFIAFETPKSISSRKSKESKDGMSTIKSRKSAFKLFRGEKSKDADPDFTTSAPFLFNAQGFIEDDNASRTSSQSGDQPGLGSEISLCEDGRTNSVKKRVKPKSSFIDLGEALSSPLPPLPKPRNTANALKEKTRSRPSLLSAFPDWAKTTPSRHDSITSTSTASLVSTGTPSLASTQSSTNLPTQPTSVLRRPAPQLHLAFDRQRSPAIRLRVKDGSIVQTTSPEILKPALVLLDDLGDLRSEDWGAIILAETWDWPCPPGCQEFPVPVFIPGICGVAKHAMKGGMTESESLDTLGSPKTPGAGSDGEPDLFLHGEREFEAARKRKDELMRKRRGMIEGQKRMETLALKSEGLVMGREEGRAVVHTGEGLGLTLDGGMCEIIGA